MKKCEQEQAEVTETVSGPGPSPLSPLPPVQVLPLRSRAQLLSLATVPHPERVVVLQKLIAAAAADDHCVLNPTHVMLRGQQIIGYLSINGLPMVHCWFDTASGHALDSLKMIEHGETAFAEHGVTDYTVACAAESPFTPHMERLGFVKLGTTVLWRKQRPPPI